ncbi:MAG TPA: phosphatase domain-containing protein, partial [Longimicrobiales bacterium]|nr:phosphatase domain-containing protein [Longimicrobiales bacterium]
ILPRSTPPPPDSGHWHNVKIELVEPIVVDGPQPVANAQVVVPPRDAQFGIISDLDDTVIQTGAADTMRMVRATLLGNAHTRTPFKGVASFYAALQQGETGTGFHPIFYVSSSPWNLYDVIEQFLALQRIPMGPTLLRDWGMSIDRIPFGHAAHKLSMIRHVLEMYPTMKFILIGDSGQEDPEIYREVAREYPGRILAAYIRDISPGSPRARVLGAMVRDLAKNGIEMVLATNTLIAARHAAQSGWIAQASVQQMEEELLA